MGDYDALFTPKQRPLIGPIHPVIDRKRRRLGRAKVTLSAEILIITGKIAMGALFSGESLSLV